MIHVSKIYFPDKQKFLKYVEKIYESGWVTNNGPLVQELEKRLEEHLGVKNLLCVSNGTMALQLAYKLLDLEGEVITTPFSFVATSSSIKVEHRQVMTNSRDIASRILVIHIHSGIEATVSKIIIETLQKVR